MGTKSKSSTKQHINQAVEMVLKTLLNGKGTPVNCTSVRMTNAASRKLFERVIEVLKLMGITYRNTHDLWIHVPTQQQLDDEKKFKITDIYNKYGYDFSRYLKDSTAVSKMGWDKVNGLKIESIIIDDLFDASSYVKPRNNTP